MLDFLIDNDFLSTIVAFGLVLIPAIIFHELGHFLAAKAVGITILEFGVGYPPRIARLFSWGETEFTLNWLPLGGFVRPLGEDMIRPLNEQETNAEREKLRNKLGQSEIGERDLVSTTQPAPLTERQELAARGVVNLKTVNEVSPIRRIIFMVAGAVANVITALVVFVIIGFIGVGQPVGTRVYLDQITPESSLAQAGLQSGDFIETVDGVVFASPRELFNALAERAGETVSIGAIRVDENGTVTDEITTDLSVTEADAAIWSGIESRMIVESIQEDSPADVAGVQLEDVIIGAGDVDLRPTANPFESLQIVNQANQGKEIALSVLRNGEPLELRVTPRLNPPEGTGYLGAGVTTEYTNPAAALTFLIGPDQIEYLPLAPGEAIQYGFAQVNEVISLILELPGRVLRGEAQSEETRVVSIVEITRIGSRLLQRSIQEDRPIEILNFIALINIALGITNLLPIPPLDGGRILLVVIEMVRGRPISPEREGTILLIGIAFLLSIGVYVIINDILNPLNLIP